MDTAAAARPIAIDYRTPGVADVASAQAVPLSWVGVAAIIAIWTAPCWFSLARFEWFAFGRSVDGLAFAGGAVAAIVVYSWRCAFVAGRRSADEDRPAARRRGRIAIVASIVIFTLHAFALPQRLVFDIYRSDFDTQRIAAGWSIAPNGAAPHSSIGPYAIYAVRRGTRGEVGFHLGRSPGGVTFLWSPDDVPDPDYLFAKPTDGGPLGGGWRWLVTE